MRGAVLAAAVAGSLLAGGVPPASANATGTISGIALDDTGAPATGVCVQTTPLSQPYPSGTVLTGHADSGGRYRIDIAAGTYRLFVYDCNGSADAPRWAGAYRGGADHPDDTTPVTVSAGSVTAADVVAPRAATVSGRVTYDDGTPVARTCVRVHGRSDAQYVPSAMTRSDGTYDVNGVGPGPRKVHFGDCEGAGASYGQWYAGADSYAAATPLDVRPATRTDSIGGTLRRYASMTGRVIDDTGSPVVGAQVSLQSSSGGGFTSFGARTDSDGRWRIDHVRPSGYFVYVGRGAPGEHDDLVPRYFPGVASSSSATAVFVTEGVDAPGVDVVLPHGGRVSGRVTGPDGQPLEGACAAALAVGSGSAASALTGSDGRYTIRGVEKGAYYVHVTRCRAGNWAPQWYGTTQDRRPTAEGLMVELGGEQPNVDVQLEPGATVTGRAVDVNGQPIAGLCVTAYGGGGQEDASTDPQGRYTIVGLPTSSGYYVFWRDCRAAVYATQYTGGGSFAETAQALQLTAGTTTTVPDTVLQIAGSISGRITDARTGLRVGLACAYALDPERRLLGGYGMSDGEGAYRITGLRPGPWVVQYVDCGANVAVPEYWNDTLVFQDAERVSVGAGAVRSGVDAAVLLLTVPSVPRLPSVVAEAAAAVLSWQPPADDGSSTILSYDVLDTAGSVVKTVEGTATSTRVADLAPGRTYAFSVRAINKQGPGPATDAVAVTPTGGSPSPAASPSPEVTTSPAVGGSPSAAPSPSGHPNAVPVLSVSPGVVQFGETAYVTIHGTPGATVDLFVRKYLGTFTKIRDGLLLDGSGRAVVSTRPDMNLRFFTTDRTVEQGSSMAGTNGLMKVEKNITVNVRRDGARRYTFTGSVNPTHPGATVSLFRNGSLLRSGIPVNGSRVYTFTTTLPTGSYNFQVRTGTTGYNNASSSPTRTVRIY